jgi:hypothetical protein
MVGQSRQPCRYPQGIVPYRVSAFSSSLSMCNLQQDHAPVVRDTQGSYTFPSAMTPKSLRYKVMPCAIMLKIFSISRPDGRLGRYFL